MSAQEKGFAELTLELGERAMGAVGLDPDELPAALGVKFPNQGRISVASFHACTVLSDGSLKCWGSNVLDGVLGLGQAYMFQQIGDDELPSSVGPISVTNQVGVTVVQAIGGPGYTCALLSDHSVKCWGEGKYGTLGQGNTTTIGEYNVPSDVPPVELYSAQNCGRSARCVFLGRGSVNHREVGTMPSV